MKILFVCLGNILPFLLGRGSHETSGRRSRTCGWVLIDSAGIRPSPGRTAGQPDACPCRPPWIQSDASSRPVRTEDFTTSTWLSVWTTATSTTWKIVPSTAEWSKIHRMTEYCTKFTHADHVPDPYYGGSEGFEYVLDILEDACAGLLQAFNQRHLIQRPCLDFLFGISESCGRPPNTATLLIARRSSLSVKRKEPWASSIALFILFCRAEMAVEELFQWGGAVSNSRFVRFKMASSASSSQ